MGLEWLAQPQGYRPQYSGAGARYEYEYEYGYVRYGRYLRYFFSAIRIMTCRLRDGEQLP